MVLIELIETLEKEAPNKKLRRGLNNPHSYRGYYDELAFELGGPATVGEVLTICRSCLGTTFHGYKGGEYTMGPYSTVNIANYSECGEELGPVLLGMPLKGFCMTDPNQPLEPKPAFDIPLPLWGKIVIAVLAIGGIIAAVVLQVVWS